MVILVRNEGPQLLKQDKHIHVVILVPALTTRSCCRDGYVMNAANAPTNAHVWAAQRKLAWLAEALGRPAHEAAKHTRAVRSPLLLFFRAFFAPRSASCLHVCSLALYADTMYTVSFESRRHGQRLGERESSLSTPYIRHSRGMSSLWQERH